MILDRDDWATWLEPSLDARDLFAAVRSERFGLGYPKLLVNVS